MSSVTVCAWCGFAPVMSKRGKSELYKCPNKRCYQYGAGPRTLQRWNAVQTARKRVLSATNARVLSDSNDVVCLACGMTSYNGSNLCDNCAKEAEEWRKAVSPFNEDGTRKD